jgi:hypothetical protein
MRDIKAWNAGFMDARHRALVEAVLASSLPDKERLIAALEAAHSTLFERHPTEFPAPQG